ncbi:hypothetical protein AAFN86_00755 [Roseomonas sp. CAU 1739]|uniref:hypothetical protein n=1 Tax=Roseomonas sp. CAU 1739 TaxID=3140364 RepID=UPI00325BCD42
MDRIEPPRPAQQAARTSMPRDVAPEPSTGRALWPTFMRRTLDEDIVRVAAKEPRKPR